MRPALLAAAVAAVALAVYLTLAQEGPPAPPPGKKRRPPPAECDLLGNAGAGLGAGSVAGPPGAVVGTMAGAGYSLASPACQDGAVTAAEAVAESFRGLSGALFGPQLVGQACRIPHELFVRGVRECEDVWAWQRAETMRQRTRTRRDREYACSKLSPDDCIAAGGTIDWDARCAARGGADAYCRAWAKLGKPRNWNGRIT